MTAKTPQDLTQLLNAASAGEPRAAEALWPLIYDELRAVAARQLQRERPSHTLQATALVHEAYLRLIDQRRAVWAGRTQFLAVAATIMRRILVNHERDRRREKRGGGASRAALTEDALATPGASLDLLALDDALLRLAAMDPRQARIVELRFFGGLSTEEVAQVLGVSQRTVEREWTSARAWLRGEVAKGDADAS